MKKQFLVRFVVVLFVFLGIGIFGLLWWYDGIAPVDSSNFTPVTFAVKPGESVRSIVARLASQGLIRSSTGFYILIKVLNEEKNLQAGDFRLNKSMDAKTIARELTHGIADIWVTILEGWRVEEIATKLTKELDIPEREFLAFAHEGYMFPDTYQIPRDATAGAVALMFQNTFDKKVTEKMREDAKHTGLSLDKVIIVASIVEREGRTDEDRPIIAGILLKRLKADWPLQADATLQYALGYQSKEKIWWKRDLTDDDKRIRSSYNTYEQAGLPPGPISNPGLSAIEAVIYAKESPYWYYLHDGKGIAHYAKTLEEHERNIAQFL